MDQLAQPAEHVGIGLREHAVAEVEDVTGSAAGAGEHVARAGGDALPRREQQGGVEVALHAPHADAFPAFVEGDPPVEPDHIAAGRRHHLEERRGAGAEMDRRHPRVAQRVEHARRPRRDELLVIGRRKRADPRVEQLHDVGAGTRLHKDVRRECVAQRVEERRPHVRLGVHEPLRHGEVTRRPAFDEVAGDSERSAAEPDQRLIVAQRPTDGGDRLEHRADTIDDARRAEALDVRERTDRLVEHGADAFDELDGCAHRDDRRHDVREDHGRVDVVPAHGLERHLGGQLGGAVDVEEPMPLTHAAVLRKRPPCLPHEPHRGAFHGLAPRRADEQRLHAPRRRSPAPLPGRARRHRLRCR